MPFLRQQKVPARQSYTEAAGDSEDTNEEEADDVEEEDNEEDELEQEDNVEEEGADDLPDLDVPGPSSKAAATMLLLFVKASGSWRRSVVTRRTWAEATPPQLCGDQGNQHLHLGRKRGPARYL